ncbi:hypothetical protein V2J09_010444 [Rumex salicifolius]
MSAVAANRTTMVWRRRLGASLRILVACATVAITTLYAPLAVRSQLQFPAFAYVTAVLIVSEATLGDVLRGTWNVVIGTSLVMGPAIISLWLIRPERFTAGLAALAVAVGAFGVALAESAPILAKRIAFGQMVIVYVGAVVLGADANVVMHPFHVAASTGVGAMSAILAMLVPFPRLACYQIKRKSKAYAENATERLNLFVKAIVDDVSSEEAIEPLTEIKSLSEKASRLLQTIDRSQDAMLWEKPQLRLLSSAPNYKNPSERLREVELILNGMEMAMASYQSQNPKDGMDEELKNEIRTTADQLRARIVHIARSSRSASSTAPEIKDDAETKAKEVDAMETSKALDELPVLFTIQCMNYLKDGPKLLKNEVKTMGKRQHVHVRRLLSSLVPSIAKENMLFAFKCSLSLGLAVLLGLTYTKKNGYWSGLTIAISFVTSRQATFTVTNARAQGTALGSIYGVIMYFICHKFGVLKLFSIVPWVIFTTFLRHSKMYGEAGSTSATIAALLILGRRIYGTPTEFAIARLTEAFIGLSCFIIVEILMRPERAAVLVKGQVSLSLRAIGSLLEEMALKIGQAKSDLGSASLQDKRKEMRIIVQEMGRLVREAREEPNFWFTPFPDDCYTPVLESLKKMDDTLFFMTYSVEVLCLNLERPEAELKGYRAQLSVDVELFKRIISNALESVQEGLIPRNCRASEGKEIKDDSSCDIETGREIQQVSRSKIPDIDKEEAEIILGSFLQHARDLNESAQVMENLQLKKQILLSVGSIVFCMERLVTETAEIGKMVREIIRRENL